MKNSIRIWGKLLGLALGIFALMGVAQAEDTGIGNEFPSILRGVRPLGLGNSFLTMKGTDFNAQFYNPAAINDYEKKHHFMFLNPGFDFNISLIETVKDVLDLKDNVNRETTDAGKIRVFDRFVQTHAGSFNTITLGLPLFHIRHKYYAAGLLLDSRSTISLRDRTVPNFELRSENNVGIVGGGAYGFFEETLQVGGNLKVLYKGALEERITTSDVLNRSRSIINADQIKRGIGVGADLGAKYALPIWRDFLRPTVAVTLQDVADTRFSGGAPKTPMSASAGVGVFPSWNKFEFAVLADFRELNRKQDILKKIHGGVEVRFPKYLATKLSLRAGTNQGYAAGGLSLEWPIVALHAAFYGEEVGEFNRSKSSYRLASQLTFGF